MPSMIEELASQVIGDERNTLSQCRKLIQWMHAEFEWSVTDYQRRTVHDILDRRAGNCAEQARVLKSLIHSIGIETRGIAEINIQPMCLERGQSAEKMVMEKGPAASVFGYMHNDHRWLEVKDASSGTWFPADATLGICGVDEWMAARIGFDERPESGKDMIVPIMIFVMDDSGRVVEDRTEHYLVHLLNDFIGEEEKDNTLFVEWCNLVRDLSLGGRRAFHGENSFFEYGDQLKQALDVYRKMESKYHEVHPIIEFSPY